MEIVISIVYFVGLLFIFLFSLSQLHLTLSYLKAKRKKCNNGVAHKKLEEFPYVTIQLPVYNELYVVERLIDAVSKINYPKEKLEIQVLDDSTDETVQIIENKLNNIDKAISIQHIRRPKRVGFKAGALQYGLKKAKGEFITIFDADFLPIPDFLLETLPYFKQSSIGMVQTRWGHINRDYSLLTKLQAFGLDAHFTIEQVGRKCNGSFINFNGTAGVWRKECIEDAGGWQSDTLTEDLDLSYRAQLKGWQFEYLEEVVSPAELPIAMSAIKSQQFRWNKGAAESAKKHLRNVLTSSKVSFTQKVHAFFHLMNSSTFFFLLVVSLASVPMLWLKNKYEEFNLFFHLASIFLLGFFSICFFYWVSTKKIYPEKYNKHFFSIFPLFLAVSMGLSIHNSLAVLEGWLGIKTNFIRTPKFNIGTENKLWKKNVYLNKRFSWSLILETLAFVYFCFGVFYGISIQDYGLLVFHLLLATGFLIVSWEEFKVMLPEKTPPKTKGSLVISST